MKIELEQAHIEALIAAIDARSPVSPSASQARARLQKALDELAPPPPIDRDNAKVFEAIVAVAGTTLKPGDTVEIKSDPHLFYDARGKAYGAQFIRVRADLFKVKVEEAHDEGKN